MSTQTEIMWHEKYKMLQNNMDDLIEQVFLQKAALMLALTALEEHAVPSKFVPGSREKLIDAVTRIKEFA